MWKALTTAVPVFWLASLSSLSLSAAQSTAGCKGRINPSVTCSPLVVNGQRANETFRVSKELIKLGFFDRVNLQEQYSARAFKSDYDCAPPAGWDAGTTDAKLWGAIDYADNGAKHLNYLAAVQTGWMTNATMPKDDDAHRGVGIFGYLHKDFPNSHTWTDYAICAVFYWDLRNDPDKPFDIKHPITLGDDYFCHCDPDSGSPRPGSPGHKGGI